MPRGKFVFAVVGLIVCTQQILQISAQQTETTRIPNPSTTRNPSSSESIASNNYIPATTTRYPSKPNGENGDRQNGNWDKSRNETNSTNGTSNERYERYRGDNKPGDGDFCKDEDGCDRYAAVYCAVTLFVMLTIGMFYVIFKRRKGKRFIGNVQSPPLLEMRAGYIKDELLHDGAFISSESPQENLQSNPSFDNMRVLQR